MNIIVNREMELAEEVKAPPSMEETLEAARTLQMVRTHVSGFGRLEIKQSVKRGRGRVIEARLLVGRDTYARFVKPELAEIIQPAVDVLTRALNENYSLSIDTSIRNQIVLSISV